MAEAFLKQVPDAQNIATWWAAQAIDELGRLGIQHLVISPGSRSTPLTMAASAHPDLESHVILDERSAAFTALGMGRATGIPAVLICTSGTAVANYLPAVVEARQSGIPLLLMTADRPPHLRQVGASQAIDQLKIYGDYPVFTHEVGEPQPSPKDTQRLRMAVDQAVQASITEGGPSHLNFPFRKPLEPEAPWLRELQLHWESDAHFGHPFTRNYRTVIQSTEWPIDIRERLKSARRPLFIAGPQRPFDLQTTGFSEWAQAMDAPLLVDAGAQPVVHPHVIAGYDGWLRTSHRDPKWQPDLIIRLGDQPVSKALELAFQGWDCPILQIDTRGSWQDATLNGGLRWRLDRLPEWPNDLTVNTESDWLNNWQEKDQSWQLRRKQLLRKIDSLTDGHVYFHLLNQVESLPQQLNGMVSNSFPVRDMMLFGPSSFPVHRMHVTRGASGIDGITSAAIGATIASGHPSVLFTGDLAFLHDSNALLQHSKSIPPLLIIVLNNGGGDIFKMLPIQDHPEQFDRFFKTPQQTNLGALCEAHGVPHREISSIETLREQSINDLLPDRGLRVIECITDSEASMTLRRELWGMES
ncbi:MAG: 2-succinyl-5-enolpyruvyl-6-hydroxy-3-cyclohexene-1-carboxylic-acid synthase [Bacteroidota bacterium]